MAKHKQIGMGRIADFSSSIARFGRMTLVVIVLLDNQAATQGQWQARLRQRCSAKS